MNEQALEDEAARQLEEAGFFVQRAVRVRIVGTRDARIDIVAWTGADTGELTPDVVVEVKRLKDDAQRATAARQLGYFVPLVDAVRAYIFEGSRYRVSDDCETPVPAACPRPNVPSEGAVVPQTVIAELVEREFDRNRNTAAGPEEGWRQLLNQLTSDTPKAADKRLVALAGNAKDRHELPTL
ncbi:MAG: hypothetical protein QM784_29450 [Polyangiaceae bacterium]